MITLRDAADEFLAQRRIAVAGVSRDPAQPANLIYRRLRDTGHEVFPVNPHADEVEGDRCYAAVTDLPVGVDVEIDAPPEDVWPWLAPIGQDRAGFYSYDRLENLAGCRMRNADTVHPEWQDRELGEEILLHWSYGLPVSRWEPAAPSR